MNTSTRSVVRHVTTLTADRKTEDGGKALLNEAFDLIRESRQQGKLIAVCGPGGAIRALTFEEEDSISQRDITVAK